MVKVYFVDNVWVVKILGFYIGWIVKVLIVNVLYFSV